MQALFRLRQRYLPCGPWLQARRGSAWAAIVPRLYRGALALLWLGIVAHAPAVRADDPLHALPAEVRQVFERHKMSSAGFSAHIQRVGASSPLLSFNGERSRSPASAIKLLTTLVALEQLGPTYRWQTDVYADGKIIGDTLHGNLLIRGGGDPYLTLERLWLLVRELRQTGLKHITGHLLIDQSLFVPIDQDPGDFDNRPLRNYNTIPAAMIANFNSVRLSFTPDTASKSAIVELDPPLPGLKIINDIRLNNRKCGGYQRGIRLHARPYNVLRLDGEFSSRCSTYTLSRSLSDPSNYAADVLQSLWRDSGGTWGDGWQQGHKREDMRLLLPFSSPPLAEIIRPMNKHSSNVMTRMVYLTLGVEHSGKPGTTDKGMQAVQTWLRENQLSMPELALENGSGLSRSTRISARNLAQLLLHGWHSRYMPEFIASLPINGLDGTLKKRYRSKHLSKRLHAKTGRLNDTIALAGYYQADSGERYVLALLHNAPGVHQGVGHKVQGAMLNWLQRIAH